MSKAATGGNSGLPSTSTYGGGSEGDGYDAPVPEYKYQVEIAQMMFVFADVVDPTADVTRLVEDIVRNQVIEMIVQSRRLAQRRASRFLSPEDLIFLIRYDRAKVNRLRTYLSWKDVRKNAKESGDSGGAPGGAPEMEALEDPTAIDGPSMKAAKMKIRLPWEITSIYSEHLISLPGADGEEDEDEDDVEAHADSMQRLKDADEATRRMTRDEYVHYSECRQASFTFRKAKRFREFINASAYLDVKPNDDIIDILGFLAFEVVRELCVGAVAIKNALEAPARTSAKRKRTADERDTAPEQPIDSPSEPCTLFSLPPSVETPLRAAHIREAFARLQRRRAALTTGFRGSGGPGGLRRTRVFVI